ncbi:MAG: hypothetical protein FWE11_07355 [Defluviitaleaceae bacterium]|nr:hypothetical protein [Defluviitaleaceae bacterium]
MSEQQMNEFLSNTAGEVGKVSLRNQGGFVVKLDFVYKTSDGKSKRVHGDQKDITLGKTRTLDPGEYGVPEGATFTVHADVFWGKDNVGQTWLNYRKTNAVTGAYVITGTTLSNQLGFMGLEV